MKEGYVYIGKDESGDHFVSSDAGVWRVKSLGKDNTQLDFMGQTMDESKLS